MCDLYWHFWSCYRQILPSVRAVSSHSTSNSQKYKSMLPFCYFVILFTLSIRVKYGRKLFFDAKEVTKWRLELGCKNRFIVIDNRVKQTVILHHYVSNDFC